MNHLCQQVIDTRINQFVNTIGKINKKDLTKINSYNLQDILFFCTEILDKKYNNHNIEEIIENIMVLSLNDSHKFNFYNRAGVFYGLGKFSYCIRNIYRKTGELKNLYFQLVNMIENQALEITKYPNNQIPTSENFDLVTGVSGILIYLLEDFENCNDHVISEITEYISKIINLDKKDSVGKFYEFRELVAPNSYSINFGMAHGLLGPGLALCKAYEKGYDRKRNKEIIDEILSFYAESSGTISDRKFYPSAKKLERNNGLQDDDVKNFSWCRGEIGIIRGLMNMNKIMNYSDLYLKLKDDLFKIVKLPDEEYHFSYPILCHGLSGIIVSQINVYIESKNSHFLSSLQNNIEKLIIMDTNLRNNTIEYQIEDRTAYLNDYTLLTGQTGVILTLLKYSDFTNYAFDQIMCL